MGLFTKRPPCAICGGKVTGLFPWKFEDYYVCNDCHGVSDLPDGMEKKFTLDDFRAYMEFRDENAKLKNTFSVSESIDFGLMDTKILFDYQNKLFCFDKKLGKTIFHGSELKSFSIKEDSRSIFDGSANGLSRHESLVPQRVMSMSASIDRARLDIQRQEQIERQHRMQGDTSYRSPNPTIDVPEPFKSFNVEIFFEHKYWQKMTCDMTGPVFDRSRPNADDYLSAYYDGVQNMERLANAFMNVAFSDAASATRSAAGAQPAAAAASSADPIDQLKKYKELLDQGVITQSDFDAKKKQLMGI